MVLLFLGDGFRDENDARDGVADRGGREVLDDVLDRDHVERHAIPFCPMPRSG